ncbi:MAG: S9 family peptidase [Acidobacteria bacterium]|nr:S9 family peptidase [Acidobacteriota bacterium]
MRAHVTAALALLALATIPAAAQDNRRPITLDDHSRLVAVADPQRSPEGEWVAYTVTTSDVEKDKRNTDIWMVRWDGSARLQLTSSPDDESSPRWSPDGKYLAFVASRGTEEEQKKGAQIWLLDRRGGEARKVSEVKGGASAIQWSPDSTRIAFVIGDEDPDEDPEKKEGWKRKTPPPIVIDRYHFKQDREGYLRRLYDHIAVLDISTGKHIVLTSGQVDDSNPSWSPDGKQIAFLSKRAHADPDRTANQDLWVIEAREAAAPRQVTSTPESESGRPVWSPDGARIAVLLGDVDRYYAYDMNKLAMVPAPTAASDPVAKPALFMSQLDRAVSNIEWSADGESIAFLVEDDRRVQLATVPAGRVSTRGVEPLTTGNRAVRALSPGKDGHFAVLMTTPEQPPEVFALEGGTFRQLTSHNDALMKELQLATTEDFQAKSKDGAEVHGLIVKPAGYVPGRRYPTLAIIHGGPNGQDEHEFDFEREFYAAHGYVVLTVNYRGSAGRGSAFQKAIYGDWGNLEVVDILGMVDEAVRQGIADPERLGIGGWSYGGISTNYTIATDPRFKAAVSGAGSSAQASMYGLDQYIVQWDVEIGPPWKAKAVYEKVSYPFFHADRIKTPTLFMGGEKDFNVPIAGSEQMYQALRSLGVPTELVIYPGQFHSLTVPSYQRDRLQRYVDWFNKHLQPAGATSARP